MKHQTQGNFWGLNGVEGVDDSDIVIITKVEMYSATFQCSMNILDTIDLF